MDPIARLIDVLSDTRSDPTYRISADVYAQKRVLLDSKYKNIIMILRANYLDDVDQLLKCGSTFARIISRGHPSPVLRAYIIELRSIIYCMKIAEKSCDDIITYDDMA